MVVTPSNFYLEYIAFFLSTLQINMILEILSNNKETHLKLNPNASYEDMRKEMRKLIDHYEVTRKAELYHLNPASHDFAGLKSPEYQAWHQEKVRLENETKIAYSNMDLLARHFCPKIYIV